MGYKQPKDMPPMERELNYLLHDLCVKWGFCIPPEDQTNIAKSEHYTADSFARDVLVAEGLDPGYSNWTIKIANKFIERFGTDEIDAASFVDRIRTNKEDWSN